MELELMFWLGAAGAALGAGALAWTRVRPTRRRRVMILTESDPNDVYTC